VKFSNDTLCRGGKKAARRLLCRVDSHKFFDQDQEKPELTEISGVEGSPRGAPGGGQGFPKGDQGQFDPSDQVPTEEGTGRVIKKLRKLEARDLKGAWPGKTKTGPNQVRGEMRKNRRRKKNYKNEKKCGLKF